MDFIDYYDLLCVSREATRSHIIKAFNDLAVVSPSGAHFELLREARDTLINPYRRARYDKTLGYRITVQAKVGVVSGSGERYVLIQKVQSLLILQNIKEFFKKWVLRKSGYTWEEAEEVNYGYRFAVENENPYLILAAPKQKDLQNFANSLVVSRKIRVLD